MDQLPPKSDPGYADALYELADSYFGGWNDVEKDKEQAVLLWKEAAEMDHADSMDWLGYCYKRGYGCEKDLDIAFYWYKKRYQIPPETDPRYADALYELARRFYYGDETVYRDFESASYLFQRAAQEGHANSMHQLGDIYKRGELAHRDDKKAVCWYKKAAEKDHFDSIYELGECYRTGLGCEKELDLAFVWYQKAAQRDNVKSMVELGACYKLGHGCQQDSDLALELWEKAAQQEDGPDELYRYGWRRIHNDYSVGYGCLSIALKSGHKEALAFLMYYHQQSAWDGNVNEKIEKLRKVQGEDPSDFIAVFLLAECLSNSFELKELDEATSLLATIPRDITIYARSQWLVPFLEEKKNIICLSSQSGQSFPTESDHIHPDHLEIVALIGEGQFGKVYLAKNRGYWYNDEGRWVAVKYLNDNEFEEHQDAVTKLMRERLANQILKASHSQNTAKYMGIVTDFKNKKSGLVFEICADLSLVMEDAEDRIHKVDFVGSWDRSNFDFLPDWRSSVPSSLRSAVVFARDCPFSMAQLLIIFLDVAAALHFVHSLGILHRDIADRNVLCDGNGNVQLADFGMSRFVGVGTEFDDKSMHFYSRKLTEGNQYAVAWWPPECLGDRPIFSFASDVFSFFVMVWQCLAEEDPFSNLLNGDGDPFVRISSAIIRGERPDLRKLRDDTPARLRYLIEGCWVADPSKRPTLVEVIAELKEMIEGLQQEPAVTSRPVNRRKTDDKLVDKWFDVKRMYLTKPIPELVQEAQDAGRGSFPFSFLQRLVAEKVEKAASMTVLSPSTLRILDGRRPHDVFILHSGEQKPIEVSTLKTLLELGGFRCFYDYDMKANDGEPVEQMEFAFETCRYFVVVISKDFLAKEDPRQELLYSFDRSEWLKHSPLPSWSSLRVVLLDLSVKGYTKARISSGRAANGLPNLPPLEKKVVMMEFNKGNGRYTNWPTLCELLGDELQRHDKDEGAVQKWNEFLQGRESLQARGFPRANNVYGTSSSY